MAISVFEKKRHVQGTLRTLATEHEEVRGQLSLVLEVLPLMETLGSLGAMAGLCVAGRQHKGIGPFGVGAPERNHLVQRRNPVTAQAPQILSGTLCGR